ncbi:universal stress protein [Roseibium sp. SCP14]|uniref:universal stress protein n=1 Tax=Roseibium sp. SCP14 TaxID=3141375 RepID=UPI0033354D54
MTLKNIAIGYRGSENTDTALHLAITLSKKYGAALSGLCINAPIAEEPQFRTWMPETLVRSLQKASDESVQNAEMKFRETAAAHQFAGPLDWVVEQGDVDEVLSRAARYHDLLVIGQYTSSDEVSRYRVQPENVVIRAGRPLLIVPADVTVQRFERPHVTVAWDGSRSAARALSDALLLFGSECVFEVTRVVGKERASEISAEPGRDIIKYLTRHGVEAREKLLIAGKHQVAQTLVEHCSKSGSDFLVMGAYGHSRLREDLFGSVSRTVIEATKTPVLMAH